MKSLLLLTSIGVISLPFHSCTRKDDINPGVQNALENSSWTATTTDADPSTNPPGEFGSNGNNRYYAWSECHMDDTFSFSKDHLTINDAGTACNEDIGLIFETTNQTYTYNAEKKQLTVGSGAELVVLDVYELNKDRLKLGITTPTGTGMGHMILLFERK